MVGFLRQVREYSSMKIKSSRHREVMTSVTLIISIVVLTMSKMEFGIWLFAMAAPICLSQCAHSPLRWKGS